MENQSWFDGRKVNETLFSEIFAQKHNILFSCGAFFTPEGRVDDLDKLRTMIFDEIKGVVTAGAPKIVSSILDTLKLVAIWDEPTPDVSHVHLANGTLDLNGNFTTDTRNVVRCRLPLWFEPDAPKPETWLNFLGELMYSSDIPTLQEFLGYCLIPTTKAQKMLIIKGSGGEGKSQIGAAMAPIFGCNVKDGSVAKISENRFARADLEHILLMIDDDMKTEALKQTNYVKAIVTAQGKMDLEVKGKQSHQGWMFARMLAFSNGDLQSLYDKSDGFYRRQLVITTKPKMPGRVDDPHLAEKLKKESSGIFLWMFEGLQRLIENNYVFTESARAKRNRENAQRESNNILSFLDASDYVCLDPSGVTTSHDLYEAYLQWCRENGELELKQKTFTSYLNSNCEKYGLVYTNNMLNSFQRRVWGFKGIRTLV